MSQAVVPSQNAAPLPRLAEVPAEGPATAVWAKTAILTLLVFGIFWSSLWRLWSKTNPIYGEGNWGHSFIVPLIGLYYLFLNREELFRSRIEPVLPTRFSAFRMASGGLIMGAGAIALFVLARAFAGSARTYGEVAGQGLLLLGGLILLMNWGVGSLVFGLLTFGYGIWPGQNDYVKDLGLVITIFGIVLTLCGWHVMRVAWFPIFFLICALPWPGLVYSWLAGPLSQLAATVAVFVLQITGVDAIQGGTKIVIENPPNPTRTLNVAEACAGLRSLMTFITVGAAVAFLSNRPLWQKLLITASAVPIAILCNVMRVSGQGLLDTYVSQELAEGFAHQFVGLIMLIPAFFMLLGVAWVVDHLFVEEVDAAAVVAQKPTTIRRNIPGSANVSASGDNGHNETTHAGPRRPHL